MTREELIHKVSALLHADQLVDAAKEVAVFSGIPASRVDSRDTALELCNSLLYWCLNNDHYEWAAEMLWGERLFTSKPYCTRRVWEEIKSSNKLMLMGAASMSKSYGAGAWLLLDWVRDPEYTFVGLVGPSEDHLKDNLFTHMVTMHSQASLPLPGVTGDLFIGLDPKKRKGAIRGIVIPTGKKSGRLQGRKRVPRKTAHPQFGEKSRMRIFLDELEKIPVGVWKDIDNVFANLDEDIDGFKIMGAFNPEDPEGPVAQRCEPDKGWEAFDAEHDECWVSKRGWKVLRLDAAKSENVVQRREVFPGLQTHIGFENIISNSGGTDTPGYWTMARACFPPKGAAYSVIPSGLLSRMKGEFIFAEPPTPCAGGDLSLEGSDPAVMAVGRFGKASGYRLPPNFEFPNGREIFFRDEDGRRHLRYALQVDQIFTLPKAETTAMAARIREECLRLNVDPDWLMLDRTGNGAGVHDLLLSLWSNEVQGVNYSAAASDSKILEEDLKTAKEEYERAVSELWFSLKKWGEFGYVRFSERALSEDLSRQLSGRRYQTGKLTCVESKRDYKSRGNPSPNEADAVTLLLLGVRRASGVIPSALKGAAGYSVGGSTEQPPVPCVVDETNKFESIEGAEEDWLS